MRTEDYLAQNALGFEGDTLLYRKIHDIISAWGINLVVETGTYLGNSTKLFAELCEKVISVEINKENFQQAQKNTAAFKNISLLFDSSDIVLPEIIERNKNKRILFFLDAHWGDHCPLMNELNIIVDKGIEPVIIIHDFKVPGHPELGFDSYKGQDFTFEWIKPVIEKIYPDGYEIEYNSEATGAKRGVIFIYPMECEQD